jgi:hypothetical protein
MTTNDKSAIGRRDLLRVLGIGASAAVTPSVFVAEAQADSETNDEKRKVRYQPDSADVKSFYRVNSYPK